MRCAHGRRQRPRPTGSGASSARTGGPIPEATIPGGDCMTARKLEAQRLQKEWTENPRWKGVRRSYTAEDVVRLRGSVHVEHTLASRGAESLWDRAADRALRQCARRADRQPGDAAGAGRARSRSICRAGKWRAMRTWPAKCTRTSRCIRPIRCRNVVRAHQQHADALRPDPVVGRQGSRSSGLHRLLRADRGRRGSRFRRRAQRLSN